MLTTADKEEIRRMIVETVCTSTAPANGRQEPEIDSNPVESAACQSDPRAHSIVDATARAIEVFGTREKALRWLKTPLPSLGNRTPLSLLNSSEGIAQIQDTLGRIEHGVW